MWIPTTLSCFTIAVKKSKSKGGREKKVDYFTDVHGLPCIDKIVTSVDETPVPITTHIIGKIPEWISGNFLRNGPGKFEIGNQKWALGIFEGLINQLPR